MGASSRRRAFSLLLVFWMAGTAWLTANSAWAAKDFPGCSPLADTDFKLSTLVSRTGANALEEPLKMAFDMNAQGHVDIYFVERKGKVRKFAAATREVSTLGSVPANVEFEGGLAGIALDPGFKTNRMIYLYYSHGAGAEFRFRLSRFTLNGAGQMDAASEKVVLAIPATAARLHTGGAMAFDPQGNLYVAVGDNAAGEEGPGNTNDLRGKILRIKPTAEGGYTVPAGNLFPPGMAKTRPEIYIMGTRNAYSITMDPVRGLVAWGDVGPDGKGATEEHNVAAAPGNFGYPYYAGDQVMLIPGGTPDRPVNNNARNTGLNALPPAIKATNAYAQAASVTGPIYRYNPRLVSAVKFPPHFEGMWFVTDFNKGSLDTILLNTAGTAKVAVAPVFRNIRLDRPLDFQQGPDGALYAINYSGWFSATATTALVRIEYTGSCRPADVVGLVQAPGAEVPEGARMKARGSHLDIFGAGRHSLRIADLQGRVLAAFEGAGDRSYDLSGTIGDRGGLYLARLTTAEGSRSLAVILGR